MMEGEGSGFSGSSFVPRLLPGNAQLRGSRLAGPPSEYHAPRAIGRICAQHLDFQAQPAEMQSIAPAISWPYDLQLPTTLMEVLMERVLGIGGVFFKARDPLALANWYREH